MEVGDQLDTVEATRRSVVVNVLVSTLDPPESVLYRSITVGEPSLLNPGSGNVRMPFDAPMPDADVALILRWIEDGAPGAQCLVSVPLPVVVTARIARRSQRRFVAPWTHLGALHGQIEEAFTDHSLIKVFGRRREVEDRLRGKNEELFQAAFRTSFLSSVMMPAVQFIANLNYLAIIVVGGWRVAQGAMLLGSVQAFIQYSRTFSQHLGQLASMASVLQSGVASAERCSSCSTSTSSSPIRRRRARAAKRASGRSAVSPCDREGPRASGRHVNCTSWWTPTTFIDPSEEARCDQSSDRSCTKG